MIPARLALPALALLALLALTAPAPATMVTKKLGPTLCKTVGGGRFVDIPGFPGERIDRRLLADIRWMKRRFHVFITDGYSTDPVHSANGEHPIGLATDIVPNFAKGGTWNEIGDLAHRAEPEPDQPRAPWRWVGWNGDPGHGRGDHLHLSWMHSETEPRDPARVVYTRICPDEPDSQTRDRDGGGDGTGGVKARGGSSGGISAGLAPAVSETGGLSR